MMRPDAFSAANRREQPHAVNHANQCTSFRHHAAPVHPLELREQLKHDDLVHLMYDAAHNTASRATRWTEIDSKKVHAMRDAREGHSVTYLQSEEVPAGIHVRRQGARVGATGTGKSLSLRCELTTCRRCSELSSPRSVRISTGEGDSDTLSRPKRLCARAKRPTNSGVLLRQRAVG